MDCVIRSLQTVNATTHTQTAYEHNARDTRASVDMKMYIYRHERLMLRYIPAFKVWYGSIAGRREKFPKISSTFDGAAYSSYAACIYTDESLRHDRWTVCNKNTAFIATRLLYFTDTRQHIHVPTYDHRG